MSLTTLSNKEMELLLHALRVAAGDREDILDDKHQHMDYTNGALREIRKEMDALDALHDKISDLRGIKG